MSGVSARLIDTAVGLTPGHTSLIIAGTKRDPAGSTLAKLAQGLDIELDWLVLGEGEAPNQERVRAAVARGLARAAKEAA